MNGFDGFPSSWNGFIDYHPCFYETSVTSIIVGSLLSIGIIVSTIPQIFRIMHRKTSEGISPIYCLGANFSQGLVVLNILIINYADFYGLLQVDFWSHLPRFLTILTNFFLYYFQLPVTYLMVHFGDDWKNKKSWFIRCFCSVINTILPTLLYFVFVLIASKNGIESINCRNYARGLSVVSAIVTVIEYLPQYYTSCKLQDNGSLSLVTFMLQSPGGAINVLFMILSGEDWSMWMPMLVSNLEQWVLFIMLLVFKCRNRIRARLNYTPIVSSNETTAAY